MLKYTLISLLANCFFFFSFYLFSLVKIYIINSHIYETSVDKEKEKLQEIRSKFIVQNFKLISSFFH